MMALTISQDARPGRSPLGTFIGNAARYVAGSDPCPYAYGTRRENLGNPGANSADHGAFLCHSLSMAAGLGTPSGVPVPWFRFLTPFVSRHPFVVRSDGDGLQTYQESTMFHDTPTGDAPEIRSNTIHFPLASSGAISTENGYTGFTSLRSIFALDTTVTVDETAGTRHRFRTDRAGLLALLQECEKAQDALTDAMKTVGVLTVYADRKQIDGVDLGGIGWLITGLAELKEEVDAAASLAAHALANGGYLPERREGDDARP